MSHNQLSLWMLHQMVPESAAYTVVGTANADTVALGSGVTTLSLGGGDDLVTVTNKPALLDVIDGGANAGLTSGGQVLQDVAIYNAPLKRFTITAQ